MTAHHDYIVGYIGGSGRSGSTILDMMLGANASAFSTGQLAELRSWIDTHGYCTCGRVIDECPFWSQVLTSDEVSVLPTLNVAGRAHKITGTLRAITLGTTPAEAREADAAWSLFARIAASTGKRVVIDSSKAALRLAQLMNSADGTRVRLIHLVREPCGYVSSVSFATRAEAADGAVGYTDVRPKRLAVADWLAQNILVLIVGIFALRGRYRVVTYEQMTLNPEGVLPELAEFLGMEFEPSMLPPLERTQFHLIGGNSSRLGFSELRYDDKWRRKLNRREKFLIQVAGGWLYWILSRLAALQGGTQTGSCRNSRLA
jgi:hypothetical protein